ncbi:metallophosphoesterase [Sphingorhabdus sp.]|uniref:metallophosphoesterase n=1 Tax=Sphingorhabdus sp. TaxID=1902408 RepID=UPI003D8141D0
MAQSFEFGGAAFEVAGQAALYWRAQDALLVSDLHLEKASAFALVGQMLPPYDSVSTLEEIATLCRTYRPAKIISLGDNFHDDDGEHRLAQDAAALLVDLACNTEWIWITGNHDRAVSGIWGGKAFDALTLSGITLRHEALSGDPKSRNLRPFSPEVPASAARADGKTALLCEDTAQVDHAGLWRADRWAGCAGCCYIKGMRPHRW